MNIQDLISCEGREGGEGVTFTRDDWPRIAVGWFVCGSSFWTLLSDLTYSSSIVFILENIRDLFITGCSFICFYKLLHHRFFQYLNDFNISISHRFFRFEEFPSVLRSIDYLLDNKQIDFTCFFRILPSKSRMSLKFVTNKLYIVSV